MLSGKGQGVAPLFTRNPEIATSLAPLRPVRCNPSTPSSGVCDEMCEFMPQRAIDFLRAVRSQPRIQGNDRPAKVRASRCRAKTRIPFNLDMACELREAKRGNKRLGFLFQ